MNSTNKNIDIQTLDKTIVYLNSDTVIFNTDNFDISFELSEPIKNVVYIKIMKVDIKFKAAPIDGKYISDGDPIYVNLKNFNNRFIAKTPPPDNNIIKCFEIVTLNFQEKYNNSDDLNNNKIYYFKTEYTATGCNTTDTNVIVLNPFEPIINRFDLQLYDKNNQIISRFSIIKCTITLCIYHSRKNLNNF